jgi:[acyl-carrier-protein] S-malonyltransferase
VNNIDVAAPDDPTTIRDALYRQAFGAVRWVEVVQALRARGCQTFLEMGPGKVLAGMVKRIDGEASSASVFDPPSLAQARALVV